jgi:hypothetical protein
MPGKLSGSNDDVRFKLTESKTICAGKGCSNLATYCIRIAIINRAGNFCMTCKKELEEENLVLSCSTIDLEWKKRV